MIIGLILSTIGIMGSIYMWTYIISDGRYNYSIPLTGHETMVLVVFSTCFLMAAAGIATIISSIAKKNNEDTLKRINNIGQEGIQLGVCPHCGINVTQNTEICPKCGTKISKNERN